MGRGVRSDTLTLENSSGGKRSLAALSGNAKKNPDFFSDFLLKTPKTKETKKSGKNRLELEKNKIQEKT